MYVADEKQPQFELNGSNPPGFAIGVCEEVEDGDMVLEPDGVGVTQTGLTLAMSNDLTLTEVTINSPPAVNATNSG
jgi:hypothetical protein